MKKKNKRRPFLGHSFRERRGRWAKKGGLFLLFALILVFFTAVKGVSEQYGGIYDKTVRLHILADSDEKQAQTLKLEVRDGLLEMLEGAFVDCADRDEAERILWGFFPALQERAEQILLENGCDLPVSLSLEEEIYPLRIYDGLVYPAGEYLSLRVFIGRGEGQNWWCVVYPPLCLSSGLAQEQVYTEDEEELLTGRTEGYRLKFAFLELGERIFRLFGR